MPGECCQRYWMTDQYAVQPVVRRDYVEQPVHRSLLETGRAWRVHAVRPPGRYECCCHSLSITRFEHSIYILILPLVMESACLTAQAVHQPLVRTD